MSNIHDAGELSDRTISFVSVMRPELHMTKENDVRIGETVLVRLAEDWPMQLVLALNECNARIEEAILGAFLPDRMNALSGRTVSLVDMRDEITACIAREYPELAHFDQLEIRCGGKIVAKSAGKLAA